MAKQLFDMIWQERIKAVASDRVLATGFSCRCQTKRFTGRRTRHPAGAVLAHLDGQPQ